MTRSHQLDVDTAKSIPGIAQQLGTFDTAQQATSLATRVGTGHSGNATPRAAGSAPKVRSGSGAPPAVTIPTLVASPASVQLFPRGYALVNLTMSNGAPLPQPTTTAPSGLLVNASVTAAYYAPGIAMATTWAVTISQPDRNSQGQGTVTFTANGSTTSVSVSWSPEPGFSLIPGSLVRSEDASTITYTAYFSIAPTNPAFGTPTIATRLFNPLGSPPPACIGGKLSETFVYGGQNNFWLSCTVAKQPPYVPGSGPPPPLPSAMALSVDVTATMPSGFLMNSPPYIGYVTPSPYDQ
ncbi:MAG TPA: hypothetical protein VLF91_02320 [Candidatus Saccharimonadales bacterium]|nr:hypothetical protein [Candidatus Saccharimonadales bacterium]